jgi:acyl-coenzyme A synthetase/AMP-(fatty) acid ligase
MECTTVIHGSTKRLCSTLADISSERPDLSMQPILSRCDFDKPQGPCEPFVREKADEATEKRRLALIMHSSGSTGYPKPLFQCHEGVLIDLLTGLGCRAFNPLPWFHLHGFLTSLQAIYMQKTAYLWNSRLPLTAENIITAVSAVKPDIFHGVPYTIKLLSEIPEGVALLRQCQHVTSRGARPPDELGDKLIKEGVHFSTTFGLTETGHIEDSMRRESGDRGWDYLRLHSYVIPHMVFNKISDDKEDNTYLGVFLKSHPALLMSNSDDPPGSYHSGDIFITHPSISHAWKYIARNDDCITLGNGEKINPMAPASPHEGCAHVRRRSTEPRNAHLPVASGHRDVSR